MNKVYEEVRRGHKRRITALKENIRSATPESERTLAELVGVFTTDDWEESDIVYTIENLARADLVFVREPIGTWSKATTVAPLALRPEMTTQEDTVRWLGVSCSDMSSPIVSVWNFQASEQSEGSYDLESEGALSRGFGQSLASGKTLQESLTLRCRFDIDGILEARWIKVVQRIAKSI